MTKEIELMDIIPTNEQVEKYAEHINNIIPNETDKKVSFYKITDGEKTDKRLNEYLEVCDKHNLEHDVLLSSLIHAKIFEIVNGESDE